MTKNSFLAASIVASLLLLNSPVLADTSAVNQATSPSLSSNWSGYVAQNATSYSAVGASWVVPTPKDTSTNLATDATWVGIGGVASRDLIQVGTQALAKDGQVQYEAWYETLPDFQQQVPLTIHGGDSVTASLAEISDGVWHIRIADNTTGKTYERDVTYDSSRSSAEWIEEMPVATLGRGMRYLPLDNFGSVTFTGGYTVADGTRQSIAGSGAQALTMATPEGQTTLATPSELANDSFSITRDNESTPLASTMDAATYTYARHSGGRRFVIILYR